MTGFFTEYIYLYKTKIKKFLFILFICILFVRIFYFEYYFLLIFYLLIGSFFIYYRFNKKKNFFLIKLSENIKIYQNDLLIIRNHWRYDFYIYDILKKSSIFLLFLSLLYMYFFGIVQSDECLYLYGTKIQTYHYTEKGIYVIYIIYLCVLRLIICSYIDRLIVTDCNPETFFKNILLNSNTINMLLKAGMLGIATHVSLTNPNVNPLSLRKFGEEY